MRTRSSATDAVEGKSAKKIKRFEFLLFEDCLVEVFSFLPEYCMTLVSLVSKMWHKASKDQLYWKSACFRAWGEEDSQDYWKLYQNNLTERERSSFLYGYRRDQFYGGKPLNPDAKRVWQTRTKGRIITPIVFDNRLFFVEESIFQRPLYGLKREMGEYLVICYDANLGTLLWDLKVTEKGSDYRMLDLSIPYRILLCRDSTALTAMTLDGEVIWRHEITSILQGLIGAEHGTFILRGSIIIVPLGDHFVGLDILTGETRWSFRHSEEEIVSEIFSAWCSAKNKVYCINTEEQWVVVLEFEKFCLKPSQRFIDWDVAHRGFLSDMHVADETLVIRSSNGSLYGMNCEDFSIEVIFEKNPEFETSMAGFDRIHKMLYYVETTDSRWNIVNAYENVIHCRKGDSLSSLRCGEKMEPDTNSERFEDVQTALCGFTVSNGMTYVLGFHPAVEGITLMITKFVDGKLLGYSSKLLDLEYDDEEPHLIISKGRGFIIGENEISMIQ